jgi:hypothetical protein
MYRTIFSLLATLTLSGNVFSQQIGDLKLEKEKKPRNHYLLLGAFALVSGGADGFRDSYEYHNDRVLAKLHTNSRFFRPDSWRNKYKSGNPEMGERFMGSTSVFVFVTDLPHLAKFTNNLFTAGAIALQVGGGKRKWWVYVIRGVAYWIVNRVGFSAVYNSF